MDELLGRFWYHLVDRVGGPLTFRIVLQPLMAAWLGLRAGLRDAREGRPAYLWGVTSDPAKRRELLKDGLRDVARVYVLAAVVDGVYQYLVFRWIYPVESIVVAFTLALIPYVLIRGPVNRLARRARASLSEEG
jgi:hypothetical protein